MPDLGSLGLDDASVAFLERLPEDIQSIVAKDFNPSGTKDGNVLGRLLGFARSVWSKRLAANIEGASARDAASLIWDYPDEVQARVLANFNAAGTKDGNVFARLESFAASVAARVAKESSSASWQPVAPVTQAYLRPTTPAPALRPPQPRGVAAHAHIPAATSARMFANGAAADFCGRMGLHGEHADFISRCPPAVQEVVFNSFDPSGTKDGNVWGRLFGFVRSVWAQKLGLDASMVKFLRELPEEAQQTVIMKFDPSRTKDGNVAARLESFARSVASAPRREAPRPAVGGDYYQADPWAGDMWKPPQQRWAPQPQSWYGGKNGGPPVAPVQPRAWAAGPLDGFVRHWGLNQEAAAFLADLPEDVSSIVFQSFNATGTKDGNVWGRLFGFVRSVWVQRYRIPQDAFTHLKQMPEEVQMSVLVNFDPNKVFEGDIIATFDALANNAQQDWQPEAPLVGDQAVVAFAQNCGLDQEAVSFLESLPQEVLEVVLSDFDPGGTKDGNVLARLQGFARSIESRKKRGLGGGSSPIGAIGRNVRPRY